MTGVRPQIYENYLPARDHGSRRTVSKDIPTVGVGLSLSSLNPGLNTLNSLPCLLFLVCLRDTFIPDGRKLRDPRRLYAPGRMYHIVERKFCRCGRFPPEVRTAIPVDGRFEHIVLLCNGTSDHAIIWIERESESAKFQAIYEKFSKEKATHLQTLKGIIIPAASDDEGGKKKKGAEEIAAAVDFRRDPSDYLRRWSTIGDSDTSDGRCGSVNKSAIVAVKKMKKTIGRRGQSSISLKCKNHRKEKSIEYLPGGNRILQIRFLSGLQIPYCIGKWLHGSQIALISGCTALVSPKSALVARLWLHEDHQYLQNRISTGLQNWIHDSCPLCRYKMLSEEGEEVRKEGDNLADQLCYLTMAQSGEKREAMMFHVFFGTGGSSGIGATT
nr:calmodulin-binding heat-shock protein [Ipomoea batatas]GME12335.1 calmodulin-binding heat-shock protein [Ipomoea batatas]GME14902.1 calmodulin-binding heat-shock protein [Ipomoea batatas]